MQHNPREEGVEAWESTSPPQPSPKWQRSDKKRKSDSTIRKNSWEIFAKMGEEGLGDEEVANNNNNNKDSSEDEEHKPSGGGEGFSNLQDMLQWRLEEDKRASAASSGTGEGKAKEPKDKRKAIKAQTIRTPRAASAAESEEARRGRAATSLTPRGEDSVGAALVSPRGRQHNASLEAISAAESAYGTSPSAAGGDKRVRGTPVSPAGKQVPAEKASQLQQLSSPSSIWDRARLEAAIAEGAGVKEEHFKCLALHAYQAQRDGDLSFNGGDVITVTKRQPSNRWWHGTLNGKSGVFPANYVKITETVIEDKAKEPSPGAGLKIFKEEYPEGLEEAQGEITYEEVEEEGLPARKTKVIATGPLIKLVEALVIPRTIPEPFYVEAFLLTRSYFISSANLLRRLCQFYLQAQEASSKDEEVNKSQKPLQARVLSVFQKWVENNFYDFQKEPALLESLIQFAADNVHTNVFVPKLIKSIRKKKREYKLSLSAEAERKLDDVCAQIFDTSGQSKLIDNHPSLAAGRCSSEKIIKDKEKKEATRSNSEKSFKETQKEKIKDKDKDKLKGEDGKSPRNITQTETSATNWPLKEKEKKKAKQLLPSITMWERDKKARKSHRRTRSDNGGESSITFLEISAKEMAQQLTHIEQDLFVRVCPLELLFGATGKSNKHELAPNVMHLVEWFNKIVGWVATQIVTTPNVKERRIVLKRFIEIAQECRKVRNYFALQEIISALNLVCIQRLQNTWRGLSKPEMQAFTELSELMARGPNNYQMYRQEFSATEPPHLPYVGVHLSDLVALDQLPTCIKENNHVNFKKMRKIEQAARPILSCSTIPYTNIERPRWVVYKFLTQDLVVKPDQQLFELSKQIEPSKQV